MLTVRLQDFQLSTSDHRQFIVIDGQTVEIEKTDKGKILINGKALAKKKKAK